MSATPIDAEAGWAEVQAIVDEIAELSERETSADRFHEETLRRLQRMTSASEATAWLANGDGFAVANRVGGNGEAAGEPDDVAAFPRVLEARRSVRIDDAHGDAAEARSYCGVYAGDDPVGVLGIVQPPGTPSASVRAGAELLEAVAELVGDFHRNRLLADFRERERDWEAQRDFRRRVLVGGPRRDVAVEVANEGRAYVDCARLTVFERHGRRWRVAAVSGAVRVEERARVVRRAERLANVILPAESDFLHVDGEAPGDPYPPQVEEVLDAFLEESPARLLHLVALRAPEEIASRPPAFAMLVERFDLVDGDVVVERARRIAPDAAGALHAARGPTWWERVAAVGVWWAVLAVLLVVGVVLTVVPADFTVPARGVIEPAVSRYVFAPRGGFVRELKAKYGKDVDAGEVVVELVDPDLALDVQEVAGEIEKVTLQLEAAELARLPGVPREPQPGLDPSARVEELKKVLASLRERKDLLDAEVRKLVVRAPVGGRIVTWDLDRRLGDRPLVRGDVLLRIARFDGPWRLRLDVPDDEFGHVRAAQTANGDSPLRVEYALATEPESMHDATIDDVALVTDLNPDGEAVVRAEVELAAADVPVARPGATVVAVIHVGRRPLGYVWFHEAIHAVRTWWYR